MPELFALGLFGLVLALVGTLGKPGRWLEQRLWQEQEQRHRRDEP